MLWKEHPDNSPNLLVNRGIFELTSKLKFIVQRSNYRNNKVLFSPTNRDVSPPQFVGPIALGHLNSYLRGRVVEVGWDPTSMDHGRSVDDFTNDLLRLTSENIVRL